MCIPNIVICLKLFQLLKKIHSDLKKMQNTTWLHFYKDKTQSDGIRAYLGSQLILSKDLQEVITLHPGQKQLKALLHGLIWVDILCKSIFAEKKKK